MHAPLEPTDKSDEKRHVSVEGERQSPNGWHVRLQRPHKTTIGPGIMEDEYDESGDRKDNLKDKLETLSWVWRELLRSTLALLIGIVAYEFNDVLGDQTGQFSRSGALIVLLAIINEYKLGGLRDRQLDYQEPDILRDMPSAVRRVFKPSTFLGQTVARRISHVQVVVGTVIWGYGDLFVAPWRGN